MRGSVRGFVDVAGTEFWPQAVNASIIVLNSIQTENRIVLSQGGRDVRRVPIGMENYPRNKSDSNPNFLSESLSYKDMCNRIQRQRAKFHNVRKSMGNFDPARGIR